MSSFQNISIIGAGNLAWHLAPALENAGHRVVEVWSREHLNASKLVERLYEGRIHTELDFSESVSSLFIICVSDDAIENVAREIVLPPQSTIVHTSGSVPMEVLEFSAGDHIGVIYPLQTFSRGRKIDFTEVPIFIEASDTGTLSILKKIGKGLTKKINVLDSESRMVLHIAAVFASNFSNHMLTVASNIAESRGLKYKDLLPLISEAINKSLEYGPHEAQTGPARRNDLNTLEKHFSYLDTEGQYADLYKLISEDIIDEHEEDGEDNE